jgi:hypothetical protein
MTISRAHLKCANRVTLLQNSTANSSKHEDSIAMPTLFTTT